MELQLLLVPSRAECPTANLDYNLGDWPAIEVAALGFGDGDSFGQIVEKLDRFVVLVQRSVAEDACAIERQRGRAADLAAQAASSLAGVKRAQSVYLVMVESSRRFSD